MNKDILDLPGDFDIAKFLKFLMETADSARYNAGMGGRHDDGGAGKLESQVEAYKAGMALEIPSMWRKHLETYQTKIDPEYHEYLRLKEKFGKR